MGKIIKLESILNSWFARRLTLLGKITKLLNPYLFHKLCIYYLPFLPFREYYTKINLLLYEFLWGSKRDRND